MLSLFGCTAQQSSTVAPAQAIADSVGIPVSDVTQTARHYEYDANGVKVRYFAVKGSDGEVRTAFDACEVCYRSNKGYTQVGNDMRCNNCGLSFNIDALGTKNQGKGCWPGYLPHKIVGDNVVIMKSYLEAGSYMFS